MSLYSIDDFDITCLWDLLLNNDTYRYWCTLHQCPFNWCSCQDDKECIKLARGDMIDNILWRYINE